MKLEQVWDRLKPNGDCWEWTGSLNDKGYARVWMFGKNTYVHRAVYEYMVADIPSGLELDHLCRNTACVNPYHLEPVTHAVNVQRGRARAVKVAITHCPKEHPYTPENTRVCKRGRRTCISCQRQRVRDHRARQKEKA